MSTLPHPSALLGCIHTCCGPGLTEGIHRAYQPRRCINVGHFRLQVSTLVLGSQDEDYPFACPPGTVGGTNIPISYLFIIRKAEKVLPHLAQPDELPVGAEREAGLAALLKVLQPLATLHLVLLAILVLGVLLTHLDLAARDNASNVRVPMKEK